MSIYSNKEAQTIDDAKRLCMERDCYKCRHCGTSSDLEVKQLDEKESVTGWRLSNLITLCGPCLNDTIIEEPYKNRVGVILAGGRGTRLYPLTKYFNKHELGVGLTPMIFYPIKTLRSFGIERVLIVIDRENTNQIINMLGSGKEFGMSFTYRVQEGSGGISDALYLAKDFAKPGDEIYCILGDNIFGDNIGISSDFHLDRSKACIFLKEVNNPEDYGIANIDEVTHKVISIVEKPKTPTSNLAVLGLYIYTYDVFDVIDETEPSERGEMEISSVNDYFASTGELEYVKVSGYWADCGGSISRYCEASLHGARKANVSEKEVRDFISIVFEEK